MIFAVLLAVALNASAQLPTNQVKFDFRGINVAQVVQLIYSEAIKDAYVIDPEVLNDNRSVSFRYDSTKGDIRAFIASFLDSIGLAVTRRGNFDYITRNREQEKAGEETDVFVYRPRFRDGSYLADILGPLFQGAFTAKRGVRAAAGDRAPQKAAPAGSAADAIDRKSDLLVFSGTAAEVARLKKIIAQVDTAVGDVMVRGVLYEVQTSRSDGSAFGLALNLLGGKIGVGLGPVR